MAHKNNPLDRLLFNLTPKNDSRLFWQFQYKKKQIIQNLCRKKQLDWRPKIQHLGFLSPITHTFWEFLSVFSAKPAYILKTYMQEFWQLGFFKELLLYLKKTCRGSGDKSDLKFWTFQLQNSNCLSSYWRNVIKFELIRNLESFFLIFA